MKNPKQKPKSDYNLIPINIRGDRQFVNRLKSVAARVDMPIADYVREKLENAIGQDESVFFASRGSGDNRNGNG